MGDILSQNEIDQLLQALDTGELDVNQIKDNDERKLGDYDFRRPNKFAKDHLRTLKVIHEEYARYITNFLFGYLRTAVSVEVFTVEEISYGEFNNSISNPSVLSIVDFSPLKGIVMFDIDPNIVFVLIDRILGGNGKGIQKLRTFTEIELAIIEKIVTQMLGYLKESWESIIELNPTLERIETNSQFAQIINPNEMVALVTFNVKIGDTKGMINLCIPHFVVEPVISKLSTKLWFATVEREASPSSKKNIEKRIENAEVNINVILGKTTISVSDFIGLQKGDVIQLDSSINSNLDVMVGNILKFQAKPGVKKNKIAVKIADIVREEENDI